MSAAVGRTRRRSRPWPAACLAGARWATSSLPDSALMSFPMSGAARYNRRQNRMRHPTLALRQVLWMVCACVLLLPRFASAAPSAPIDLDGDGRRDRFMVDRREPSVLQVWLSASDTTQVIRTRVPLLQVVATDLDGDHLPELIARDSESQIHVWTRKTNRFRSYRPHDVVPGTLRQQPSRRSIDDNDREAPGVITSAPFAPALCASVRAPGLEASSTCAPRTARACRSSTAVAPFTPRPPPTDVPL
jgi:hypothetical protein